MIYPDDGCESEMGRWASNFKPEGTGPFQPLGGLRNPQAPTMSWACGHCKAIATIKVSDGEPCMNRGDL